MADYTSYLADYKETYATYGYTNTTWGDLLTNYNGTAITYDAIGNPTKWRNAAGLTWEARELQRTDLATNSYVDYIYNSDGIRTSRAYVNANTKYREDRTYILDGSKIIQENIKIGTITSTTNATLYYLYDVSGEVQGFIYNNSYYYFQKNLQGDVVRILNSSGSVVVEYTYDAWGKVLTTTGSMASTVGKYNPFRYRSYYYDTETGWYYLQSRYYDPTVGRFLNADGIIGANGGLQGYNMFAYCNNNPVMYYDPSGTYCKICRENELCGLDTEHICTDSQSQSDSTYNGWQEQYASDINGNIILDKLVVLETNFSNILGDLFAGINDAFRHAINNYEPIVIPLESHFTPPSVSLSDGELNIVGLQYSLDGKTYVWGPVEVSPFNFANIDLGISIGADGVHVSGIASLYSPSIKLDLGACNLVLGMDIVSFGGKFVFSWSEGVRFKKSALFGIDVSITTD